ERHIVVSADSSRTNGLCTGATISRLQRRTHHSRAACPLASAGTRPLAERYASLYARIFSRDAGCTPHQCFYGRAYAPTGWAFEVRPWPNPDHKPGWAAGNRV